MEDEQQKFLPTEIKATQTADEKLYTLIEKALDGDNADALEKVINLYNQQQDREIKREFEAAFSALQADLPAILATRFNIQTKSKYAKLDDIHKVIKPLLREHGFSTRYESPENYIDGFVQQTFILTHNNGHSAKNSAIVQVDSKGIQGASNKTETHGTGSALTYARRYALCGLLDITITEDDDGNAAGGIPRITPEQQSIVLNLLEEVPQDTKDAFYTVYAKVSDMPLDQFKNSLMRLKQAKGVGHAVS